ncbi:tryptophan synthase beta subunit-like PLP-dependent enzyme [Phakopsora pachyrhizi]|nr:tryptophan synthase beta subunit-like PLP-dependent enzyme [Phakopsora pachyrhizi]
MTDSIAAGRRLTLDQVAFLVTEQLFELLAEKHLEFLVSLVDEMILVSNDEICAGIKDVFEDTRSIPEPAGALAIAGLKRYLQTHNLFGSGKRYVCIVSGANMNFDRLRFVAERADLGENREALLSVVVPEKPGSSNDPNITPAQARQQEISSLCEAIQSDPLGMKPKDISDNEMAKSHARYLIGGRVCVEDERLIAFEFPERPGALKKFLAGKKEFLPTANIRSSRNPN